MKLYGILWGSDERTSPKAGELTYPFNWTMSWSWNKNSGHLHASSLLLPPYHSWVPVPWQGGLGEKSSTKYNSATRREKASGYISAVFTEEQECERVSFTVFLDTRSCTVAVDGFNYPVRGQGMVGGGVINASIFNNQGKKEGRREPSPKPVRKGREWGV